MMEMMAKAHLMVMVSHDLESLAENVFARHLAGSRPDGDGRPDGRGRRRLHVVGARPSICRPRRPRRRSASLA